MRQRRLIRQSTQLVGQSTAKLRTRARCVCSTTACQAHAERFQATSRSRCSAGAPPRHGSRSCLAMPLTPMQRPSLLALRRFTPSSPGGSEGEVGGKASSSRMGVQRAPPRRCLLDCTEGCPPPIAPPPPPPPCRCTLGVRASLRGVHCMACGEPPPSEQCMDVAPDAVGSASLMGLPPSRGWHGAPLLPSRFMWRRSQAISCKYNGCAVWLRLCGALAVTVRLSQGNCRQPGRAGRVMAPATDLAPAALAAAVVIQVQFGPLPGACSLAAQRPLRAPLHRTLPQRPSARAVLAERRRWRRRRRRRLCSRVVLLFVSMFNQRR